MKRINFGGDLTDNSIKKEALRLHLLLHNISKSMEMFFGCFDPKTVFIYIIQNKFRNLDEILRVIDSLQPTMTYKLTNEQKLKIKGNALWIL